MKQLPPEVIEKENQAQQSMLENHKKTDVSVIIIREYGSEEAALLNKFLL
jgi:hypothetical protein